MKKSVFTIEPAIREAAAGDPVCESLNLRISTIDGMTVLALSLINN